MNYKQYPKHPSSLGIPANILAMLVYVIPYAVAFIFPAASPFMFILPIVLFFIERASNLVRFHALQYIFISLLATLSANVLFFASLLIPQAVIVFYYINIALFYALFASLIYSAFRAFKWQTWPFPLLGKFIIKLIKEEA